MAQVDILNNKGVIHSQGPIALISDLKTGTNKQAPKRIDDEDLKAADKFLSAFRAQMNS